MKYKYAIIKDLVPGRNFDFFNNFEDQIYKNKTVCINDVGKLLFDLLSDDEQTYVLQMKKYSHLNYDDVIKKYDQDTMPNYIKHEKSLGWKCDKQGNIIGFID